MAFEREGHRPGRAGHHSVHSARLRFASITITHMILDRYPALLLAFPLAFAASAQPTLVAPGNVPIPGDGFTVHRGAHTVPPGSGENQTFNFSSLSGTSTLTYQWRNPADLPNGSGFPGAQFALVNGGADTIFYKATSEGLERIGDTQTISALGNSFPLISTYTNSMLDLKLPLSHGGAWTDVFEGSFVVQDGSGDVNDRNGAIMGEADAWGRVVMPGGADTVEALCVRTKVTETIPLNTGLGQITVQHVRRQSAFYPLWGKFPVLRIVSDTLDAGLIVLGEAYTEWLDSAFVGVAEHPAGTFAAQVFPNPAADRATLVFANPSMKPLEISLIDARGSMVRRMWTGQRVVDLDLRDLDPGMYGVLLTDGLGNRSTVRLMVAR